MPARDPRTYEDMERLHLWLYSADIQRLRQYYGTTVGLSRAIRAILRTAVNEIETRARVHHNSVKEIDHG